MAKDMLDLSKFAAGDMVSVLWMDAISEDSWTDRSDLEEQCLAQIHTVGILISNDPAKMTIGLNHDIENDKFACSITVPSSTIVSVTKLTEAG